MKHLHLYLFLINLCSITFAAPFDPSESSTYYFTANSTASDKYALFITAQSSFANNIFQYTSQNPDFTNFITALDIVKTNLSISLIFQNTWTQQDADSISQDTSRCVNQIYYNCNSPFEICSLLAPIPSSQGILNISSEPINCTGTPSPSANSLCDFTLSNFDLTDPNGNIIFSSDETLCPQQTIEIIITVEVYKAYIPAMPNLVGSSSLTFHYFSLLPAFGMTTTTVSTSRIEIPSKITQSTNLETYQDDSYLERSDIKTVIQTKLVQHDYPSDIYCQYQVNYTGLIRGIYINDYPSSNHMPREYDLDSQSTVQSTLYFQLRANQINLINIVGYRLNETEILFNNCKDKWKPGGNNVQPTFSDFIFGQVALEPENHALISNSLSCPCKQCTYSGICTRCSSTKYLAYGSCQTFCPQPISIPDYKQICNTILEGSTVFLGSPQIDQDNIIFNYYDDLGGDQAIVLHAKNQLSLNPAPIVWPNQLSLLPESILVFLSPLESQQGVHQLFIPIPSIANSSIINSFLPSNSASLDYPPAPESITSITNKIFILHYPLNPSTNYFIGIYWSYQKNFENLTLAQQRNPSTTFLLKNRRYQYLSPSGFYIFQAFVSCNAECEIQVTSDGTVQLYKNDQVLLFDLTFKSRWTYTYTQKLTGSIYLKFVVRNANYFQPYVSGDDFQLYAPLNPTSIHAIGPLPVDQHACSISNCLTCQDSICFSCESGYFLTLEQSECVPECPSGSYYSSTERTCEEACDISQTKSPSNNECLPICKEPGYYFTPDIGCQVCVPDCETCYNATTCSKCKIDSVFNTPTFCFRKTGTLFDLQNFTLSQTVTLQRDSDLDLALIITDSSYFGNFTFYFYDQPRKIPRILKTLKMASTGNTSTGTIPPLDISEPGYISVHYLKIQELPGFSSTGFRVIPFKDWPLYESVPQIDSATGPIVYNSTINDDQGLTKLESEYETLVASRIYEHDQTSQFTCRLQITYYGDLRGVYANGELIFAHSTSGTTFVTKLSQSFMIYPEEMVLMTFVGYRMQIQNVSLTQCTNTNKIQITPKWTSYVLQGPGADPDDFLIYENNTFCADHCKTCYDEFTCITCETNYYLNDDGLCLPKCSNPNSIQLLYGLCQTEERSQGYLSYYYYSSSTSILTVEFDIVLEVDLQFLIIAHPFNVVATPHATFAFLPSGMNPSLASGVYQVQNYYKNQTELDISMNLKSIVSNSYGGSVDLIISTVRNNMILFYYYNSKPTTLTQLSQAQDFNFLSLDNQTTTLTETQTYYWDFYFNCTSQCHLTIQGKGNVEITQDERTLIFSAFLDESFGAVTLLRTFSGLGHLVIKVWNSTSFRFDIQGASYTVFAQGDLVSHNTISAISYQPIQTSSNCLNGYKTKCFSCKTGYFLDLTTEKCLANCPSGTYGLLTEKICASSIPSPLIERDGLCVFNCTNSPGFYYLPDTGCKNQCNQTCQACSGPLSSHCLSCTYPRSLQSNGSCSCPIGTQDGSAGTCESISWINMTANTSNIFCSNIFCSNITLTANIRIDELTAYHIIFNWTIASVGAQTELQTYLASQSSQSIEIPGIYLNNNGMYNFTVSYRNAANKTIQASKAINIEYSVLPNFSFLHSNSQTIPNYVESTFFAQFENNATCSSLLVHPTWTQQSGFFANLIYDATFPLKMTLPSCSLPPYNSSVFKLRLSLKTNPSIYVEQILTLQTLPERFETTILTNTQNYPESANLFLDGILVYLDKCTNLKAFGIPQYTWSCDNLTSGLVCNDINGLFDSSRTTSSLTVPKTYYAQGNQLQFTLSIEKNGLIQNSSLNVFIRDSTTLITQISCNNPAPDCLKYTSSKEYLIYGNAQAVKQGLPTNLTLAELEKLNQTWTVSPPVPFAYFGDTLKLFTTTTPIPNDIDFLTINFTVENKTHKGTSSINIPINHAPIPGFLKATPNSGSSLSTKFVFTADQWQDIDIPLTYQFYYSDSSKTSLTPLRSEYDSNPQLATILPSGSLNLWVYVKDYFGAETTLNTQVQVSSSQQISLQQAINSYNQLLSEATTPFEMTQIIAMIGNEIGQWESQLSQNAPEPVCPSCSNHGYCPQNQARCVCESGWAVIDCAIQQSDVDTIVNLKQTLLQDLINNYLSMLQNSTTSSLNNAQDMIYQILENFVQDQHFNTNSSLLLVQNILNGTLDIFNPNTILTSSQIASVSEILSDMMSFSSTYDCSGSTNFTQDLLSKTQQYLEKIAQSSLNAQITNQNATVIDTQNIDMYLQKLSICTLNNKVISAGSASPQITITVNSDVAENCSYVVNLEYYAFNDNLLNCSSEVSSDNSKASLGIQVTDPATGQKSPVNMSVSINYGKDISKCPSSCTILSGTICHCDDLSPFDVGKQLLKVFANSNLFYIKKIASLLTFQFWTTASFWMIFLLTSWFIFTLVIIRYKLRKYDVMVRIKQFTQLSKINLIWMTLQVGHHLVAIYLVPNQEKLSKSARALFFYTRTLLLLSFSSIFAGPARDEDNYKYEGFEWSFNFNVYLFILPYLTIHPLLFIIKQLMIEPKNTSSNNKKSFATKILHFMRTRLTIWFVMLLIVGNFILIFIINSNQTPVQRIAWTIGFIQSLMQDLVLAPLLYMLSQYYLFKAHSSPKFANKFPKIHQKLLPRILEESLQQIFTKISPNKPKLRRINKIAPAPSQSKTTMKSSSDIDSLSAISDSPNNDSLNMEKLLKNISSPSNKFDPFKSPNYLSAAVIKEEAIEESPCLPKPSTLLYLESPNNEDLQKQNINISKLFESVDLDFAYKNPRALKFQNSLIQLQDLNDTPKENKTHGIKKLYIPDLSPKTDTIAQSKDFSDANFLLTQQQTPKDKDEELLLSFKKITSSNNDASPASLLMKRESSGLQYQNSTERSDKTLLGSFSKTEEESKLLATLRSAQSPDAKILANKKALLDRPTAQKLRRLNSETESSKAKISKPSKLNRATTGFKSEAFNKLTKSTTMPMKGENKNHKIVKEEPQNETLNNFNDQITVQNLENEECL